MSVAPTVLISRPGKRAQPLRSALERLGVNVVSLEAMQLEALPESASMRQTWLDFDRYHKVMVVSPFAAECLAEAVDTYWPQLPQGAAFYAVGAGTATVLHERLGVRVRIPERHQGDTSEALLQLPSLQQLTDQRILLIAGVGGRKLFAETLTQRGARLTRLAVYRRVLVAPAEPAIDLLKRGGFVTLVVTSGELLEHLAGWCKAAALNQPLIVSSQRLATLAQALGFRRPVIAQGATPAALAAAVADVCGLNSADLDDHEKG